MDCFVPSESLCFNCKNTLIGCHWFKQEGFIQHIKPIENYGMIITSRGAVIRCNRYKKGKPIIPNNPRTRQLIGYRSETKQYYNSVLRLKFLLFHMVAFMIL
jgi:hypothetical protein